MTLTQLSDQYARSGRAISGRLRELRGTLRSTDDRDERLRLKRRIAQLQPMLRQCRDLERLTAHYYERSFYRDEKYIL